MRGRVDYDVDPAGSNPENLRFDIACLCIENILRAEGERNSKFLLIA
jgi:hypothetical protein